MKRVDIQLVSIIVLATFTLRASIGFAQSNNRFQHFTTAEGLASNKVNSIIQDSLGYIWFQHPAALTRYDGYSLKVYKYDPIQPEESLKGDMLGHLMLDYSGGVWIGPGSGNKFKPNEIFELTQYNYKTDGFINHRIDLGGPIIVTMDFDEDGKTVWLGTVGKKSGLYQYNLSTKEFIRHLNPDTLKNKRSNRVNSLLDLDNILLLRTGAGRYQFDKKTKTFTRPLFDGELENGNVVLTSMMGIRSPQNKKEIILITDAELIKLNPDLTIAQRFNHYQEYVFEVYKDNDGVYWMNGYNNGLHRLDTKTGTLTDYQNNPQDPHSLIENTVESLWVDRDGNVWAGTENRGVSKLSKPGLQFHNYSFPGLNAATVYDAKDKTHVLVFQSKSIPYYDNPDNQLFEATIDMENLGNLKFKRSQPDIFGFINGFFKGKKYYWVSSGGAHRININPETGMIEKDRPERFANKADSISEGTLGIYEDPKGNVWIGTKFIGLIKMLDGVPYGTTNSVVWYQHSPGDSTSIADGEVYQLLQEDEKSFWVLLDKNLDLFQDGVFKHVLKDAGKLNTIFKSSDGYLHIATPFGLYVSSSKTPPYNFSIDPHLRNIDISAISEDSLGRLWFINQEELLCYDKNHLIKFNRKDGIEHLSPDDVSPFFIAKSSNGKLIMTQGHEGISFFNPLSLEISPDKTLPIINRLEINNQLPAIGEIYSSRSDFSIPVHVSVLPELVIDYQHNNFSFEFAAMEMIAPEKNLYQHKLEGYDPEWIQTDWKTRRASYTNLSSGEYTFRVKASNHHGIWSDQEKGLKVTILPPPWRTWWAYTGYSLLAAGLLLLARKNIVQRERLKSNFKLEHLELEKAKEVDRVKTSFFTNISHEFRTPLTLIKGPVQNLLEEFADNPKVQERLKLVQRNSDLLLKLINQLLDLAKLESGSLKVEKSEADLFSFIRAIASSFESFARQKGVSLSVEVPSGSQSALFDKDKLETILINLINNAVKFTPSGGTIRVAAEYGASPLAPLQRRGELLLRVSDTGIGIPADQHSKIFERFHQVSEAHKEVGTGIGLSLVKELVALMEGTISVVSQPGKGSEFTVTLPLEISISEQQVTESSSNGVPSQQPAARGQQPVMEISNIEPRILPARRSLGEGGNNVADSTKPHILVVEDNGDLRAFIIDSLGPEFHFHQAENGKHGLEAATEQVPDLIISDVMMPEMDGMEMAGKIKGDMRTSHIPLIMLTAKSGEDSKLAGLSVGADDYLTKPFNKQELLLKVRNAVSRQLKLREKLRAELLSMAPKVEVMSEDEKFLKRVKEQIVERMSDEQLSVESLAEDIGMSRVQLYRKVSGLTGMAVNELIRKLRLQRAAQLLQQNWGPVSQVAYEVGFSNLSYFSKVFKEEFGVLPSEYEKV